MNAELIAILGVGVAVVALHLDARREFRREIADLRDRVSRIEGLLEALKSLWVGQGTPNRG